MNIRNYKFIYQLYNFFKKNQLSHNLPLYRKFGLKKKYYSSVSSEDFKAIDSPLNKYDELDSALAMPEDEAFQKLDAKLQEALLSWSANGYAILENFYSSAEVDACNQKIEALLASKQVSFRYGNKIMFAFHHADELKQLGDNPRLMQVLKTLMGKKVDLFQSINFLEGSRQRTHSDSIHMTTFPYGNLIAVWIALEDIEADSGPLHYYPGSHKLPYVMNRDYDNVGTKFRLGDKTYSDYEDHIEALIQEKQLKKKVFLAKKGDLLIWHANLLHGGEPVSNESSSRKSMVFHYYSNDAVCFHEISQRPTLKR